MIPPTISVLMSVYNGELCLTESIESILNQTFSDFEFLIINDGSTDSSWEIIQRYADKDQRIVPLTQENIGLTKSLNKGILIAKGEFIARQDSDDLSLPKRFDKQLPWVKERGYDLCCSRTWLLERKRATPNLGYWLPKGLVMLRQNPFIHGTYLMRKESINKLGGYNENYRFAQDYELITRWLGTGLRVKYLKECLYQTHQFSNSISQEKRSEQAFYFRQIRQSWLMHVRKTPRLLLI